MGVDDDVDMSCARRPNRPHGSFEDSTLGSSCLGTSGKRKLYALNELPQPQVDFTFGFSNLKPDPSSVST